MPRPTAPTLILAGRMADPAQRPGAIGSILDAVRAAGTVQDAALALGVPIRTLRRWIAESAELRLAVQRARTSSPRARAPGRPKRPEVQAQPEPPSPPAAA